MDKFIKQRLVLLNNGWHRASIPVSKLDKKTSKKTWSLATVKAPSGCPGCNQPGSVKYKTSSLSQSAPLFPQIIRRPISTHDVPKAALRRYKGCVTFMLCPECDAQSRKERRKHWFCLFAAVPFVVGLVGIATSLKDDLLANIVGFSGLTGALLLFILFVFILPEKVTNKRGFKFKGQEYLKGQDLLMWSWAIFEIKNKKWAEEFLKINFR